MDERHIAGLMTDSRTELGSAQARLREGLYRKSIRDSYYAVFYAAKAGLGGLNIKTKSHQSVENELRQIVVLGHLSSQLLHAFMELRHSRGMADYDYTKRDWTADDVSAAIAQAQEFIEAIEDLLRHTVD